jgi:uncharacterized protein YbcI
VGPMVLFLHRLRGPPTGRQGSARAPSLRVPPLPVTAPIRLGERARDMTTADHPPDGPGASGTTSMDTFESAAADGRRPLFEISKAMVQIYKDQFGRGPTKVRTHYAGPDTLVCLLENTFTPAERNLQAMGEHQRLRDIRLLFQYAETSRFTVPIERITGRRVRGFVSGIDTNADVACELFVLEPRSAAPDKDSGS